MYGVLCSVRRHTVKLKCWCCGRDKGQVLPLCIHNILLIYSMEQSPSWESNRTQLVNKFPTVYGTRKFITAFTTAHHLSLSWASSIQSMPLHPTCWRFSLILSSHLRLGLPSGLFHSGFPTKTLYTPSPHPYALHAPLISFSILSPEQYWVRSTTHSVHHYVVFSNSLLSHPS